MEVLIVIAVFVIIMVFIGSAIKTSSNGADGNSEHVDEQATLLVTLDALMEVERDSLQLVNKMLATLQHIPADVVEPLEAHQEYLTESLDASEKNRNAFTSSVPDGYRVLRVENFDTFRDLFHTQHLQAIALNTAIRRQAFLYLDKLQGEELLLKQAKCNFNTIQACMQAMLTAALLPDDRLLLHTDECVLNFLIDVALCDDDLSQKEVLLLNQLSGKDWTASDILERHEGQSSPDKALDKIIALISKLLESSPAIVNVIHMAFHELVLNMIAMDGHEDPRELDRLTAYFERLEDELGEGEHARTEESSSKNHSGSTSQVSSPEPEEQKSLDELLAELKSLVGLASVKHEVNNLCNLVRVNDMRREANLPVPDVSLHLVFTGNPGTGKTTVARLLAQILRELNILSKGHLIETARASLVGGYVGQTAIKTQEVIDSALGGVLFIDEAYSLANTDSDADYGREAIETLLKNMEDRRHNLVVIVAGYPQEMGRFIHSNPGLESRFSKYVHFPDYSADEMLDILDLHASQAGYKLAADARAVFAQLINSLHANRGENFGNARAVRNLFEQVVQQHSNRVVMLDNPDQEVLQLITKDDLDFVLKDDDIEPEFA